MSKLIYSLFLLFFYAAAHSSEVIVLAQGKSKKKTRLDLITLNKNIYFHAGYPKLVRSATIPGLQPGFWVWIGGYCKVDEVVPFVPNKSSTMSAQVTLAEQKYLIKKLKSITKGSYSRTVPKTSAKETHCPIVNVEHEVQLVPTDSPTNAGMMWHKKPFSLPELSRYALDIGIKRIEASNYLAAYGYKYLQKDENLLLIIYKNNLTTQ